MSSVWHPFTQHALTPDPILVGRGAGVWLETEKGRLLDAISSWWVITHGHRHPWIVEAIRKQAEELDQVIFAGFTHKPAEDVAADLVEIAPAGLKHVFYSDSGSTSVEVALKMALGFWKNQNKSRKRIIALEHAYHGDTIGTMSAGARGVFNAAYEPLLFDVVRLPFPAPGREKQTLDALRAAAPGAAALIVEPLLLGAGGMLMYGADILHEMAAICRSHGTLLIADEVMTGFGRTGTLFACEQAGVAPAILCLAKGLSGGSLPLAATLATDEIFQAHYSTDRSHTFFIPVPLPPIRSPAPRRGPILRYGGTSRSLRASPPWVRCRKKGWPLFATIRALARSGASAPSRRWISRSRTPAIWPASAWN